MRRFLIVLLLIIFTTDSAFAVCSAGNYEEPVNITFPTTAANTIGYYSHDGMSVSNAASPVQLSAGQWRATWTSGTVRGTAVGIATCNSTSGYYASVFNSNDSWTATGGSSSGSYYCWCKMTKWIGSNGITDLNNKWIEYDDDGGRIYNCSRYCASSCANFAQPYSSYPFRIIAALFGAIPTTEPDSYQYKVRSGGNSSGSSNADGDLTAGQWKFKWTSGADVKGTLIGESSCNGTTRSGSTSTMNSSSTGKYCWCRAISWNGMNITASWMYYGMESSNKNCRDKCAKNCAEDNASYFYDTNNARPLNKVTSTTITTPVGTICTACPDGGTSNAGATEITQCYVPTTTDFTDAAGTYHYSSNCYYSN